ncbi:membrane-associated guanylate kinase, WW and PDZ domain-containing protein 2 [Nephila pilipes]|uniref:Membrane-associated guanylate kinase, WW and PDZ domain-containing protein 2 n=1 Tax=Nephila pilipes TaxID=299642 RepID=A0A8X6TPX2_NEPPI|nr:membrane-associated guanylate kinase, WW and PDZ domain-containing protein 2 [Nephila pilipes]
MCGYWLNCLYTHAEVIELIRQGNNTVRLLVKRDSRISPQEEDAMFPLIPINMFHQHPPPIMLTTNGLMKGSCSQTGSDNISQDYCAWNYE